MVSFAGLLWRMSSGWPIQVGGAQFQVPGFMMWIAFAYAAIASWITHRVGRRLVPINFDRLRFEADFRFGLVRFRENSEEIGLAGGEIVREQIQGSSTRTPGRVTRRSQMLSPTTTGLPI